MLDVIVGQATDPGRLRVNNEDAMGSFQPQSPLEVRTHGWMFVVADGAGGLDFGDVAARRTVATLVNGLGEAEAGISPGALLVQLIEKANALVHDQAMQHERRGQRMATTVVACVLQGDRAVVAHLGDSRCYHLRGGKILAVTEDHTLVNEQRRQGVATSAEAQSADTRKVLTRFVGSEQKVEVELVEWALAAGDELLLCTDGVHGGVYDQDILRILSVTEDPQKAAEELVRYAIEVDGSDNATAQVIRVVAV